MPGGVLKAELALADDQVLVRAGFRLILDVEDGIEVVGEAGDGMAAVRLARERRPDVLLMDIRMRCSTASRPPARSSGSAAPPAS